MVPCCYKLYDVSVDLPCIFGIKETHRLTDKACINCVAALEMCSNPVLELDI